MEEHCKANNSTSSIIIKSKENVIPFTKMNGLHSLLDLIDLIRDKATKRF